MSAPIVVKPPTIIEDPVTVSPTITIKAPTENSPVLEVLAPVAVARSTGRATLWIGEGPPGTIIGSVVGDEYLDTVSGTLYQMEVG